MKRQLQTDEKSAGLLTSEIVSDQLKNGMKVLVKQVYPASVVNLAVWVRVGSVNETDEIAGISHFIEHMLFKGTKKREVGQIAREIHGCGGYMNAFTDFECTCYWIILPSKFLDTALDVQADAFLGSMFDETETQKECQVIIEEMKMYEDRPDAFAFEKLMGLAYKKHHYGRPIIGFEQTLRRMHGHDLVDYFERYYKAENMFVTLVGDIEPARAIRKIRKTFQSIPTDSIHWHLPEEEPPQTDFRKEDLHGDIARSYILMSYHIPNAVHEDAYALRVLGTLLGEGRSSRLNQSLREKRSWVDEAQAGVFAQRDAGIFYVSAELDETNIEKAEKGIWEEIERLRQDSVTDEELLKAKNMAESDHIFSQETVEGQGRNLGTYEMLGDYTLAEKFLGKLFEVTKEDIRRVAQKYFSRQNCGEIVYHSRRN